MAPPMAPATFLSALRAEGLKVVEVGNWRDHNRNSKGPWGPVHGVMIHHTVTKGTKTTVDICRKGYTELPGPLCHGVIAKDGTVYLIGYGRANHAGLGDGDVLRAVIGEKALPADNEANTDGNRHFYGFECENLGDGKDPWPAAQLEAIEKAAAAVCRYHGWNEKSVIGHLEWQPGKVDPRGFTMQSMRTRVATRLKSPSGAKPQPPKEDTDMALTPYELWAYKGRGETRDAYAYLRSTEAKVDALADKVTSLEQRPLTDDQVAKIAAAVAAHPALAQAIADTLATRLKD
ncbi:N-acetylmuramoyl-L-alanine amidase [Streptomyces sp. I4(2020)]|uniref:peptidoglycan recognition protein family protein n=1 Tax=Streptomyces sp. I4(2020) TaxID=2760981 RepID=UPI0018EE7CDE|nr:N-acetylmuramoyl-L-alanine amidase [Streptomyces sp. I4(2020)]MBJ6615568.1 N-acetylmuramoyl-L-alanine amidase [Streptomyces sp. I3(2020)]MBJ6626067.1 N-acetylmuramoyl-L-alanine amidase [Streptomyces sp. I4(2020)]